MEPSTQSGIPSERYFDQSVSTQRSGKVATSIPTKRSRTFSHGDLDVKRSHHKSDFCFSLLEATTRIWQGKRVCLHNHELQKELREVVVQSFIDRKDISALDIRQLVNDIQIRHDLNFSKQLTFSSASSCEQIRLARQYFEAVAFEMVLYLVGPSAQAICVCGNVSCVKEIRMQTNRLPNFFQAIRRTMKALIREEHWLVVEQAIDVDLLMNQLRNGSSDLLTLVNWLGDVLKQSCSPLRDSEVDSVIRLMNSAMAERDGNKLASGIAMLFDVFNTMKLDVANHQMRILLPPMVDESIEFVQKKYQKRIDNGTLDYRSLWKWWHEKREFLEAKAFYEDLQDNSNDYNETEPDTDATFPDEDFLTRYTEIVFSAVIKDNQPLNQLPEPFRLDLKRIDSIRRDVASLYTQQCELMAFSIILRQCKHTTPPSIADETQLLQRTTSIKSQTPPSERLSAVAIEIVRTAYTTSNHTNLPSPFHICQARDMLDESTRAGEIIASTVRSRLHAMLEDIVFEEINGPRGIADLLPSQILDRYQPIAYPNAGVYAGIHAAVNGRTAGDAADTLAFAIRSIGQNLAHMTLIQWRVWAQLLWFRAWDGIFEGEGEYREWRAGVTRRIRAVFPRYRGMRI